ncbi:hypothetical protein [Halobacillus halophilus]|uniref:hypothetical protein n=1 Tax=Halobacillus halophilus TaxID=1570 RepID=UPI001CD53802|nr:hypothetical protein [Halobacillus halophilus]MCA1011471.1 hypothetical protein [Halobacillus halophilus]
MKFHCLHFDTRPLKISGIYAKRIDSTLVFELEGRVTRSFIKSFQEDFIQSVKVDLHDKKSSNIYTGPFKMKEHYGILSLVKVPRR